MLIQHPHPRSGDIDRHPQRRAQEANQGPGSRPSPGSHVRAHLQSPSPPRRPRSMSSTPAAGRNRRSFQHAYGLRSRRPRRQPSPAVRRRHCRSSGDGRVVEEVPHQDGRFGIHRCLLDSSVRASGVRGLRGQPGRTGAAFALQHPAKTDVLDAQWIQRLHSYGLLRASFRPPDSVLALRAYWRQRQMQVPGPTPPVMSSICRRPWSK